MYPVHQNLFKREKFLAFFVLLFCICMYGVVHTAKAQEESPEKSTVEGQRAAPAKTEAFRTAVQEKRRALQLSPNAYTQSLSPDELDRAYSLLIGVIEHTDGAIGRLSNITDRLESRARKITAAKGGDISTTTELTDQAYDTLVHAQQTLDSLREQAHAAVISPPSRTRLIEVRSVVAEIAGDVRLSHRKLGEALHELKEVAQNTVEHTEFPIDTSDLKVQ